jgi:hypothetical protein
MDTVGEIKNAQRFLWTNFLKKWTLGRTRTEREKSVREMDCGGGIFTDVIQDSKCSEIF